jgi:hypothetical protein
MLRRLFALKREDNDDDDDNNNNNNNNNVGIYNEELRNFYSSLFIYFCDKRNEDDYWRILKAWL